MTYSASFGTFGLDYASRADLEAPMQRRRAFSAEFNTVLDAVTAACAGETTARDRMAGAIDEDAFLRLCRRHRVAALVREGLTASGQRLATDTLRQLDSDVMASCCRELSLLKETLRLSARFEAAGLSPIVLKGIAIAARAYGRVGLRQNRDIDFLLPKQGAIVAGAILESLGYTRVLPAPNITGKRFANWTRRHKDMEFYNPNSTITIELHWRLFDNRRLMPVPLPTERRQVWAAHTVETLAYDVELVYLCLHGAEHAWSRLKWAADVFALLVRMDPAAVTRSYELSRSLGVETAFVSALLLCQMLFGLPIAEPMRAGIARNWRARALTRVALHCLTDAEWRELEQTDFGTTLKNASHYLIRLDPRYWAHEFAFDLLDASRTPIPPALRPFAWCLRPLFWGARYLSLLAERHRPRGLASPS